MGTSILKRTAQIGLKVEATEGTEEALTAAEFAGERKDTDHKNTVDNYERGIERGALTSRGVLKGSRLGTIMFTDELVGGGASTVAPWHTALKAQGFTATGAKVASIGTITNGPFKTGQLVGDNAAQGSATKFARVIKQLSGKIVFMPITGTFASGDTMYAYNSPQTSGTLSSTLTAAGYSFTPLSENVSSSPPSVTAERRNGGVRQTIVGARGKGGLTLTRNQPALLKTELQGCPVFSATDGTDTWRTGSPITGIAAVGAAPKVVKSIPLIMRTAAADYTPIATSLEINFDNTLAARPTMANNDLVNSGHMATRIGGRNFNATLDPEKIKPADGFDFMNFILTNKTFEILSEIGGVAETNGLVIVHAPAAQFTGDESEAERDGITTLPVNVSLTGDQDDEIFIHHIFVP